MTKKRADYGSNNQNQISQTVEAFMDSLKIPEGPLYGQNLTLAPFQREFIRGTFAPGIMVGVLSIGRGNGKTMLTAGLALGALLGRLGDDQPRREILAAARTREQAKIVFSYVSGLARVSLSEDVLGRLKFRRAPYVEIEYTDLKGVKHLLRCIAADGKNVLGTSPTLAIMDERGHWPDEKGDELEAALLSGLGKRNGRAIIISTSASSDGHSFSQWCDNPPAGCYVQEHRPAPGMPADDKDSLIAANPGAEYGIGAALKWLQAQAQRAIARGGSALTSFRLYNRNERVSADAENVLVTVDEWLSAEVSELPDRLGPCIVGVDLGGSTSMSAAAMYWPVSGRLEAVGAFPVSPSLEDRGASDGVGGRYVEMKSRGELFTMGERVVSASQFMQEVSKILDGYPIRAFVCDRYRKGEFFEALQASGLRYPVIFRGMGFKDGGEDCERFRSALFDDRIKVMPSLLLRSAFSDAVVLHDPSNNLKLAKARSLGRIDAAAATILAVAEGVRQSAAMTVRAAVDDGAVWA